MSEMVVVEALGVAVGIDAPAGSADAIRAAWSRALTTAEPDLVITAPQPYPGALSELSSSVTIAAIDHQAGHLWMVHAGGLADPASGRTVALVADAGTGKTTAVRTLGRQFGYVTDETVGVASGGAVRMHAKPLSVIENGIYPKVQRSPDALGLLAAPHTLSLNTVLLLRRDGTHEVGLEPVRLAAALPMLAPHTSHLGAFDRPLHRLASQLDGVTVHEVHYAEAEALAPVVADLVAR